MATSNQNDKSKATKAAARPAGQAQPVSEKVIARETAAAVGSPAPTFAGLPLLGSAAAIRDIFATDPVISEHILEYMSDVVIDNRAIGYRATPVGGRDASFEPMAEVIVQYDLEDQIARCLQDVELWSLVFNKLFPKKESFRITQNQGMLTMPMIIAEFSNALRSMANVDAKTVATLAHILAELTANALRHLNQVLPFDGIVSLTAHDALFPDANTIYEATRIARVTSVLEMMKLDPEIGKIKTLSAASLLSALTPMFARAGRLLISTTEQDLHLQETFLLLRLFITRDPALPKHLLTNDDLTSLASNLTYVLAALSQDLRDFALPEYALQQVISDSTLALRSLKRFTTKHLSEVKDWYVHYALHDAPGQGVTGLLFGRNMVVENRPQVTVFSQVGTSQNPLWTQTSMPGSENRVEPLLTKLFSDQLHTQSMAAAIATVATYAELGKDTPKVLFANGATEIELMHYAAACSSGIALTIEEAGYGLVYINEDQEMNYRSQSLILGVRVLSTDPAEAVIHTGLRENVGSGSVPSRVQGIPDTNRQHLLISNPDEYTNNLANEFAINIEIEGHKLSAQTSLAELLMLPRQLRLSLTNSLTPAIIVSSNVEMLLQLADSVDITTRNGEIARMRAATLLSQMFLSVSASPAGKALTRSVLNRMVNSVPRGVDRDDVRGRLRNAAISYQVALLTGARVLNALGLLSTESGESVVDLINAVGLDKYMIGSTPELADLI